ncbi:hypothetical protein ACFX2F_030385 [Malus domestica]
MAAPLIKLHHPAANYDSQFKPLMVRVQSEEEAKVFANLRRHLLNGCTITWERVHNVQNPLPQPSDPKHPCTRIHHWYSDLGLRFPHSSFPFPKTIVELLWCCSM